MNINLVYWYCADVLKAATPLVIGLLAAYIAAQQWKTNNRKLKLDLFDRRFKVYLAAKQLLIVTETGSATDDVTIQSMLREFRHDVEESTFIFPHKIATFLKRILDTADKSVSLNRQLGRAERHNNEDRQEKVSNELESTCASVADMDRTLTRFFQPLLDLTKA